MAFAQVPLTTAVRTACGLTGPATRLHGGEESAAWRVGDTVVRISAYEKDLAEAEWCHRVAAAARSGGCTEAVAPLPLPPSAGGAAGATAARIEGRTVSLWPYVPGAWAPKGDPRTADAAARLLARLHRALATAGAALPPRPRPCFLETGLDGSTPYDDPRLQDPELDTWLAEFTAAATPRHPLHGDYYHGNLLASGAPARLTAVLDWDEAWVGPPEAEVASAALEFTGDFRADPAPARRFATTYRAAGGTARHLDDTTLTQLIRHRLRRESAHFPPAPTAPPEDHTYHHHRLAAFTRLRP